VLLPTLGTAVLAFETHGLPDEGRPLAVELVELLPPYAHEATLALSFAFLLSQIALEFELKVRQALKDAPPGPWKELAFACLDRDFVRAAEIWAVGGVPPVEARVRLRAAEELIDNGRIPEGEEQARRALAFYRSVAASYYVDRCETLLQEAKSA